MPSFYFAIFYCFNLSVAWLRKHNANTKPIWFFSYSQYVLVQPMLLLSVYSVKNRITHQKSSVTRFFVCTCAIPMGHILAVLLKILSFIRTNYGTLIFLSNEGDSKTVMLLPFVFNTRDLFNRLDIIFGQVLYNTNVRLTMSGNPWLEYAACGHTHVLCKRTTNFLSTIHCHGVQLSSNKLRSGIIGLPAKEHET